MTVNPFERSGLPHAERDYTQVRLSHDEKTIVATALRQTGHAELAKKFSTVFQDALRASRPAYTPENCPSKHWNRGDDICADCGTNLN